jgi:hypothetical protein
MKVLLVIDQTETWNSLSEGIEDKRIVQSSMEKRFRGPKALGGRN